MGDLIITLSAANIECTMSGDDVQIYEDILSYPVDNGARARRLAYYWEKYPTKFKELNSEEEDALQSLVDEAGDTGTSPASEGSTNNNNSRGKNNKPVTVSLGDTTSGSTLYSKYTSGNNGVNSALQQHDKERNDKVQSYREVHTGGTLRYTSAGSVATKENLQYVDDNENSENAHGRNYFEGVYCDRTENGEHDALKGYKPENDNDKYEVSEMSAGNTNSVKRYGENGEEIGWMDDRIISMQNDIDALESRISNLNKDNITKEEAKEILTDLANIAHAADEVQMWAEAIRGLKVYDDILQKSNYKNSRQIRDDATDIFISTSEARHTVEDTIEEYIKDISTNASETFSDIGYENGKCTFKSISEIKAEDITKNVSALAEYATKLDGWFELCGEFGIELDIDGDKIKQLCALAEKNEQNKSTFAQNYINAFAESVSVESKNEIIGDTISCKDAVTKVNEVIKSVGGDSGYNTDKLSAVITQIKNNNQDKVKDDAAKKKTQGSSSSGGSTGSSSSGTRSTGSSGGSSGSSSVGSSVNNTLNAANTAEKTGAEVKKAAGDDYKIDTSDYDTVAKELRDEAQTAVDEYVAGLNSFTAETVEEYEAAYKQAEGVLAELQGQDIDSSGILSAMSGIRTKEETIIAQEGQSFINKAQGLTSGTQILDIITEANTKAGIYQEYGINATGLTTAVSTIKSNHQQYLDGEAGNAIANIDGMTTEQAYVKLSLINELISENEDFNTIKLIQSAVKLQLKIDELNKPAEPIISPDINPINNQADNNDRPDEGNDNGIDVSLSGVTYHDVDENGEEEGVRPSISFVDDEEDEEGSSNPNVHTISLTTDDNNDSTGETDGANGSGSAGSAGKTSDEDDSDKTGDTDNINTDIQPDNVSKPDTAEDSMPTSPQEPETTPDIVIDPDDEIEIETEE